MEEFSDNLKCVRNSVISCVLYVNVRGRAV